MVIPPDAPARMPGEDVHDLGGSHVWVRTRETADTIPEDDWGWRRAAKQARREGRRVNDKRIRRVQIKYQLFPIRWRSFKIATTDSKHGYTVYQNLLAGLTLTGINQAWVADITYIRILKGFVFLAAQIGRAHV